MEHQLPKLLDFLDKSGPHLYALLTRVTLRQDIAEDLMQELFIKLRNSKGFDKAKNPIAYANRAAINLAFDWQRKRKRESRLIKNAGNSASNQNLPLDRLIEKEKLEQILERIGQLKKGSREAFVMRYIQQNSYEEIAKAIGKNQHHVRAICSRAMTQIRGLVGFDKSQSFKKGEVCDG